MKYLLTLLHRADINERPTVWRDAYAAEEAALAAERVAAVPAELAAAARAREAGRDAATAGRAQVQAVLDRRRRGDRK